METLWAPWRMNYISSKKTTHCPFCDAAACSTDSPENLVLSRLTHTFVVMNRYPYTTAHLLVLPKAHIAELNKLENDVARRLMRHIQLVVQVVKGVMKCHGMNLGINLGEAAGAGIATHLHAHVVPRWRGDHNFATTCAGTRVIPEDIATTYHRLKPVFDRITDYDIPLEAIAYEVD